MVVHQCFGRSREGQQSEHTIAEEDESKIEQVVVDPVEATQNIKYSGPVMQQLGAIACGTARKGQAWCTQWLH